MTVAVGRKRVRRMMKTWRQRLNPIGLFVGYRWLAWLLAGLTLTLPGYTPQNLPLHASLLLLVLPVTLFITRQASSYLRLMQRRPILLTVDILVALIVILLSGGGWLPFGPAALGSLIAPALLFGWQGALLSGIGFVIAYLVSSTLVSIPALSGPQAVVILLFGLGWTVLAAWQRPLLDRHHDQNRAFIGDTTLPTGTRRSVLPKNEAISAGSEWFSPSTMSASSRRSAELAPAVSLRPDLRLAIFHLVDEERQRGGFQVNCQIEGAVQKLTTAQQSVLLRTAQEALANVRRHAHASSCHVLLRVDEHVATLQIEDDGVGLLDGTYERPHLHALRALRYRIAELDGQLAVFEGEKGGLTVRVTLPLEP